MKREREITKEECLYDSSNCLMLLSGDEERKPYSDEFECKTCKRKFLSFQALGGHRASHKRAKLDGEDVLKAEAKSLSLGNKPRMHECSICGVEFSLGQALGGHMRRHRAALHHDLSSINHVIAKVPVLNRSNCTRMVCLDLNLTPLENDLKLLLGKMAPSVDALIV